MPPIETTQLNWITGYIWGIADDVLRDIFVRGKYRDVILPMTVLRRFDAVLEASKEDVLNMRASLDAAGIVDQDPALRQAAGQAFYNTSKFTMKDLKARANRHQLKADFEDYLEGFSPNVQDILENFEFRNQIPRLSKSDALGTLIEKLTSPELNLSPEPVCNSDGSVKHPGLDNHGMGSIFEELVRKFNEENNEEAGEHWTPRDAVKLMTKLMFLPIADVIASGTYLLYDGACGTGGMLTVAEETLQQLAADHGKEVATHLYGQEINAETYAICKADLLLKGEGDAADNIVGGPAHSTLSNDAFPSREFDFMLSNPPYGKSWKTDLERMGGKKDMRDPRFIIEHANNPAYSMITRSSDGQLMFLINKLSKMKEGTKLGSRIAEVHNGSSLFTGDAGQGESNIRRWIIENDWLEAIIGLPNNLFYNTPMETYIWILTNRKPQSRKGKIQLVDATSMFEPLTQNLGKKTCQLNDVHIARICDEYISFKDSKISRIFPSEAFGFWKVTVERPLRLAVTISAGHLAKFKTDCHAPKNRTMFKIVSNYVTSISNLKQLSWKKFINNIDIEYQKLGRKLNANQIKIIKDNFSERDPSSEPLVKDVHIQGSRQEDPVFGYFSDSVSEDTPRIVEYEPDPELRDIERIPISYPGGIQGFHRDHISKIQSDAWVIFDPELVGYRIPFQKIFFRSPSLSQITDLFSTTDELFLSAKGAHFKRSQLLTLVKQGVGQRGHITESIYQNISTFGKRWMGDIPEHWDVVRAKEVFNEISDKGHRELELLSVTQDLGVVARSALETKVVMPGGSIDAYKRVCPGDFIISLRSFQGGIECSTIEGLVSPAYIVLRPKITICEDYFRYLMKTPRFVAELASTVSGVRQGKSITYRDFSEVLLPLPPIIEQKRIASSIDGFAQLPDLYAKLAAASKEEIRTVANELVVSNHSSDLSDPPKTASREKK